MSGKAVVGYVAPALDIDGVRRWQFELDVPCARKATTPAGERRSFDAAKRAIDRAYAAWLVYAGLAPIHPPEDAG